MKIEQETAEIESILSAITETETAEFTAIEKDLMEFAALTDSILAVITSKETAIAGLLFLKLFIERILKSAEWKGK